MWELPLLIPLAESAQPPSADLTSDNSARTIEEVGGRSRPKNDESSSCNGKTKPTHAFITSPDAPTNPAIYWLGTLNEDGRFPIEKAQGPFRCVQLVFCATSAQMLANACHHCTI